MRALQFYLPQFRVSFVGMQVIHIQGHTAIDMVVHQLTSVSKHGGLITEKTAANGGLICSKT